MYLTGHTFRRHWRLIVFVLAISLVFGLLYALRSVILPFVLGLVFAYILLPAISLVEKRLPHQDKWRQAKRVSLIVLTYLLALGAIAAFSFYIVTAVVDAFLVLINNAPQYASWALLTLEEWAEFFRQQFPPEMQYQVNQLLQEAGVALGNAIRETFMRGVSLIPTTLGMVFGFASLPIFLFYILKDSEKLKKGFYAAFSPLIAEHIKNIIAIIEQMLGRYIRAQLLLGFVVGYLVFIGLLILRIDFALVLGAFAGVTELIPVLGPWLSGATAVIVTLAIAPEKAIWVAILFLAVQLLENTLLVPRIQGAYLRIHPAVVIVLLVLGTYVAGFWGLILAVPLTATIVQIYKYVHHNAELGDSQSPPEQESVAP